MRKTKTLSFALSLLGMITTGVALAGSREAYFILTAASNAESADYAYKSLDQFFNKELDSQYYRCGDKNTYPEELDFDKVFLKKMPTQLKKIDINHLEKPSESKKLRSLLRIYHDADAPQGFDIFITYKKIGERIEFTSLGASDLSIKKAYSENSSPKAIAKPLCKIITGTGFSDYIKP
ncbi:hypothetical protein [Aquitalea magnusonii]|uniref:hypothetical protein n=1 Tax=Aquitalea magnusonii TaxID=332411 RepID=UPI0011AE4F89|nr:hypothetical protein [Aquitalea magnusonii]